MRIARLLVISVLPWLLSAAPPPPDASRGVHDPSIIEAAGTFYLFSTGNGIQIRTSTDLLHWTRAGRVFDQLPGWTAAFNNKSTNIWAPDVSHSHGQYRIYYAVSTFGSTHSAIGLVTNTTLDRADRGYRWVDRGLVVQTPANHDWNAIDPCAFDDADGRSWLVLGSCWAGIKLLPLDPATGLLLNADAQPVPIAGRPSNHIIEEGYVRRRGDWCYLWVSVDHCCRGSNSDYRLLVGRSRSVTGPYRDRDGRAMTDGGGTLVLAGYGDVRGPGSSAILETGGREYLVHHFYDKAINGVPTVQVRPLHWDAAGWPVAGEPLSQPMNETPAARAADGAWTVDMDFASPGQLQLNPDGTIGGGGTWSVAGDRLKLARPRQGRRDWTAEVFLAADGLSFVGRDDGGAVVRGRR